MKTIARHATAAFAAALASTITLGAVSALFLPPAQAGVIETARKHLPGGAGSAERYRALQATANDTLHAPRAGITQFRAVP